MNDYGLMTKTGTQLALRGVDVAARITGVLAETTLTQQYRNDQASNVELSYTFPLPVGGILLSLSVTIGERRFQGTVVPRTDAEVAYEKAIGEGNSAFRVQEIRPGMFCAALANVMAGEAVDITLTYAETLAWNGNSLRYRLPTTIAPRYGEPTGMEPWQRPETSMAAEYSLKLSVSIAESLAQSGIACPSHPISLKPTPEGLLVTLSRRAALDRDFILEIQSENVRSIGVSASARDTNIAMLSLLPPAFASSSNPRDVVLVIDCSGSMQGDSLYMAKEGVLLALGSLEPTERFGIVAFGTNFLMFEKALQPANRKNLDMARRWVNFLKDLGGTNINGALERAINLHAGQPIDILLLTDGQDWQAGAAIPEAKAKGIRIFPMGIGSAVAEDSLRMMANETGGACEFIAPNEEMSERIYRHFNRMRQPQMTRLDITWPADPIWESRPPRACFAGDAHTIFAAFREPCGETVRVSFEFADAGAQEIEVPLSADVASSDAIVRVGARQRLADLAAAEQQAWAVQYQLISPRTDYLITVERAADEKATEFPELQIQPQMLPAGWGGTSSVRYSPTRQVPQMLAVAQATGIHDAVAYGASPDYSYYDVPSVIRRPAKSGISAEMLSRSLQGNGYDEFINKLAKSSKRTFTRTPRTLESLQKLSLPEPLRHVMDELIAAGHSEESIVLAFYAALLRHSGRDKLSKQLISNAEKITENQTCDETLIERFVSVLDELWDNRNSGFDRYDIPAFLRKYPD